MLPKKCKNGVFVFRNSVIITVFHAWVIAIIPSAVWSADGSFDKLLNRFVGITIGLELIRISFM